MDCRSQGFFSSFLTFKFPKYLCFPITSPYWTKTLEVPLLFGHWLTSRPSSAPLSHIWKLVPAPLYGFLNGVADTRRKWCAHKTHKWFWAGWFCCLHSYSLQWMQWALGCGLVTQGSLGAELVSRLPASSPGAHLLHVWLLCATCSCFPLFVPSSFLWLKRSFHCVALENIYRFPKT